MSARLSSYLLLGFLLLPAFSSPQTLTVAAAADLSDLQSPLSGAFRKNEPNVSLRFVTGASALLSQQIENGAPYDVFLSANAEFIDRLASLRKLLPGSVETYAVGRLGILWRDRKAHNFNDLSQNWVRFVALPNPKLAPYGVAAQQALEHMRLWEFVRQKVVYGENVRQTLQLFESGNADAVLTAYSLLRDKNPILIPADWHQPIIQKAGIVAGTKNPEAARKFLRFLTSPAGQAILDQYGFSAPRPSDVPGRRPPAGL